MRLIKVRGPARLEGTIQVGGSKNAILPIMAATILAPGRHYLENIPFLTDVHNMARILHDLGIDAYWVDANPVETVDDGKLNPTVVRKTKRYQAWKGYPEWRTTAGGLLEVNVGNITSDTASYEAVSRMRASISVLGPLVARLGHGRVAMPGGCVIGPRPVDLHIKGLKALGTRIEVKGGFIDAVADGLHGNRVYMGGARGSTVLGTDNVMCAACLAEGVTVIEHAAQEPEVAELANFLKRCGAKISGEGTHRIIIEGVQALHGAHYRVIPDRIEAGTIACAAVATGGQVVLENARFDHLFALWDRLESAGAIVDEVSGAAVVHGPKRATATEINTFPYPGFPTDLQPQMAAVLTKAEGTSVITDRVFPERFLYGPEMVRLGAKIRVETPTATVDGVERLSGAEVVARDLRGAAALVIAAMCAEGETTIHGSVHLERGYDDLPARFGRLGADISVVQVEGEESEEEA